MNESFKASAFKMPLLLGLTTTKLSIPLFSKYGTHIGATSILMHRQFGEKYPYTYGTPN